MATDEKEEIPRSKNERTEEHGQPQGQGGLHRPGVTLEGRHRGTPPFTQPAPKAVIEGDCPQRIDQPAPKSRFTHPGKKKKRKKKEEEAGPTRLIPAASPSRLLPPGKGKDPQTDSSNGSGPSIESRSHPPPPWLLYGRRKKNAAQKGGPQQPGVLSPPFSPSSARNGTP